MEAGRILHRDTLPCGRASEARCSGREARLHFRETSRTCKCADRKGVKATSTWRMLWMTPISTRGRNPLITHSLGCPTTAEIFTPHRSHRLARIPAVPTAVEEAAAATTRVMTATEAHTEEGAIDPARVEVVMVEADIPRTAPNMATRWRKSCLPSCRWWWWRWWAQWPLIANATGGGIVSTQTNQRTCEGFRTH
nr:glycoprotein Xg isoform X4 [Equus asinus]